MAFYSDVNQGETFTPSAALSNDVRHLINGLNGFRGNQMGGGSPGLVRVQVYNATGMLLPRGTAVNFDNSRAMSGDAIPAVPVQDTSKPWGVVTQRLAAGEIGDCCISGPVTVAASGSGDYAAPDTASPDVFIRGSEGAPILYSNGNYSVINLGAGSAGNYDGPFAVKYDSAAKKLVVGSGYLSRNGEFLEVAEAQVDPADGLLCVESLLGNGEWSVPEIKFGTPSDQCCPIARCRVTGSGDAMSVSVCQFRVPVAFIIVTGECPLSAEADEANAGE